MVLRDCTFRQTSIIFPVVDFHLSRTGTCWHGIHWTASTWQGTIPGVRTWEESFHAMNDSTALFCCSSKHMCIERQDLWPLVYKLNIRNRDLPKNRNNVLLQGLTIYYMGLCPLEGPDYWTAFLAGTFAYCQIWRELDPLCVTFCSSCTLHRLWSSTCQAILIYFLQ